MRTFIAIELNEDIKELLKNTINKLKNSYEKVKWVNSTNAHLTLTFLGETETQKVEKIKNNLGKIFAEEKCFKVQIGSTIGFPNNNKARVICLEIIDPTRKINELKNKIDEEIERLEFTIPDKKEYIPHLTLGRVKNTTVKIKDYTELQNTEFEIKEITFYESILTKDGPIYKKINNYFLKSN